MTRVAAGGIEPSAKASPQYPYYETTAANVDLTDNPGREYQVVLWHRREYTPLAGERVVEGGTSEAGMIDEGGLE